MISGPTTPATTQGTSQNSPGRTPSLPTGRDARLAPGTRRLLHLDVDAFLASVEEVLHPELRGQPLVIGGMPDERNLVMTSSYAARAHGIRPGMRLAEAARRCPHAIFRRGDAQAANRLREETARVLLRHSPIVEISSIDDFFVDLTGTNRLCGDAFEVAGRIREEVREEVGLPLTIGLATNKTLARLAGKLAKPSGVAEVLPGYERAFLAHLPASELCGVGHTTRALLERFAIRTIGDLTLASREVLFATFGRLGLVLHERARGRDEDPVESTCTQADDGRLVHRPPRSIRRDSTFEPEVAGRDAVEAMLCYLVERATHRLRTHGLVCRSLEVRLVHVDTRPPSLRRAEVPEGGRMKKRQALEEATDSTDSLWRHARELLRALPRRRALTKRVGLSLLSLQPSGGWQGHLFDETGSDPRGTSRADRHRRLDAALDSLRARHGFGRVLRGSSASLLGDHTLGKDGFELRTPSLNQ